MVSDKTQIRHRTSGLRFSRMDGAALTIGAAWAILLWKYSAELALALPLVLGHFFLFCNVFRVARAPEYLWAAAFLLNCTTWILLHRFSWMHILIVQTPVTVVLLVREMRKPRYHGIFSHRINREHLDAYLRGEVD